MNHVQSANEKWLKALGLAFSRARQTLQMSVRQLSEQTGISASHILRIESGEFDFTVTKFIKLSEVLALPSGALLEEACLSTRILSVEFRKAVRSDPHFQRAVADESKREEALLASIEALARLVLAVLISSNPEMIVRLIPFPWPPIQERIAALA